jgi:predicted RNA-binding Zn ribbon-like protein
MAFVAGNPALDFVGTLNEREHARVETLTGPADLGRWFVLAGFTDAAPDVAPAQLDEALALREALFRIVVRLIDRQPLDDDDRALMNAHASRPGPVDTVDADGRRRRAGTTSQCLAAVAAAAVQLFDRDDGAEVRWCADERCTHPFLDRSRSQQRRWCDMATCGDRAKVRGYRSRRRPG